MQGRRIERRPCTLCGLLSGMIVSAPMAPLLDGAGSASSSDGSSVVSGTPRRSTMLRMGMRDVLQLLPLPSGSFSVSS
jgi:hypothetical protein